MAQELHKPCVFGMSHLYESGQFSDLTIQCHEGSAPPREIKVHRVVLCTQSIFFSKACLNAFKEGETGVISLHEDGFENVDRMLYYLYEHDYNDCINNVINAAMYAIADKYGIWGLKKLAKHKFEENFKPLHARATLSNISKRFRATLPDLLRIVYSTTPDNDRGLRNILVRVLEPHMDELMSVLEFVVAAKEAGSFAHDVLVRRHATACQICQYCLVPTLSLFKGICVECRDRSDIQGVWE